MEKENVKLILGISDGSLDDIIDIMLKKWEMWIRTVCGIFDVDKAMELIPLAEPLKNATVDLCVITCNKLGSEGLIKETVGPLTMDYSDIPHDIAAVLNSFRRVRF